MEFHSIRLAEKIFLIALCVVFAIGCKSQVDDVAVGKTPSNVVSILEELKQSETKNIKELEPDQRRYAAQYLVHHWERGDLSQAAEIRYENVSALHVAVRTGDQQWIKEFSQYPNLLNQEAVIEYNIEPDGYHIMVIILGAPIHYAAELGRKEAVKILVEHGAEDVFVGYALNKSIERHHNEIASFLIDKLSNLEAKSDTDITPLQTAALYGNLSMAKLLVGKGANMQASSDSGLTPLHFAVIHGHYDIVRLLVEEGANINARDNGPSEEEIKDHDIWQRTGIYQKAKLSREGRTPLDFAKDPKIKEYLLEIK